jgi:hypothetical protein
MTDGKGFALLAEFLSRIQHTAFRIGGFGPLALRDSHAGAMRDQLFTA